MTTETCTHKSGDSIDWMVTIPPAFADGYFVGYEVTSQVRGAGGAKLGDLVCTWADPATTRDLRLTYLDTTGWAIGPARFDVQFKRTSDGFVLSATTVQIIILEDVTRHA